MNNSARILELAEKYKDYTAANLSALVRIQSLSCSEKAVNAELKKQLKKAGFDRVYIDGLGNVIGKMGNGARIIAFDAHMDTVDTGNRTNWSFDPFCGTVKDGFVHGRGTVDQKGGAAAFVTAGRILREIGLPEDISLVCVGSVMEEDCDGLCWKYLVEEEKLKPDLVVSTEPTDLNLYRGQRGRMEIEVKFHGRSAHGSAPERGKNAVYMASRFCLAVEQLNNKLGSDDFLGKGSVTVSEFVSGSPSLCAVADYSKIHLDRRLTIGETKETALEQIRELVRDEKAEVMLPDYKARAYTGLEYGMEKYYPTWVLDEAHPAVQLGIGTYKKLYGKKPLVDKWTFSTNGVTINGLYGIPVIGFGPGSEALAHSPDEKTAVSDLAEASAFYAGLALDFAGQQ
ncbi:MAG: YgeY family selenium metabolism-linked hydrolase [Spirochaetales bacterium]|nr:YgeY family selenium metabolism-linked hydrolase [Spirochaetales bacterium]